VVGLLASPVGALILWPIAWLLRGVQNPAVHIAVYAAVGALLGVGWLLNTNLPQIWLSHSPSEFLVLLPAPAIALAVPFGWWAAARPTLDRMTRV